MTRLQQIRSSCGIFALIFAGACGPADGESSASCEGLLPGDLVITEVMANPPGEDSGNEWFELYNASGRELDLAGLVLVASRSDGTDAKKHRMATTKLPGGTYFVVGSMLADKLPAHVDYGYGATLGTLRNETGRLALTCGDVTVDEVSYKDAKDGAAKGFTGARAPDYLGNDDATSWCNATAEFAPGQKGSPRSANEACPGGPSPTTCNDGGTPRDIVRPKVGDLVISEVMTSPKRVSDTTGEWFEVYVARDLDLNGVTLGTVPGTVKATLTSADCLQAKGGSWLIFARGKEAAQNGGLPWVDHVYGFALASVGTLYLGLGTAEVLDLVTWTSSKEGTASSLDPRRTTAQDNDDPLAWCRATATYGAGDLGTPGAENSACPVVVTQGKCLDGEAVRDIVKPVSGQLVITEIMANPDAVDDSVGEWFEVLTTADLDLNDLEVGITPGTVKTTLKSIECLKASSGTHVVFARNSDGELNGGLPQVSHLFKFDLLNSTGGLFVGMGGAVLDVVTYSKTTAGAASSLDPGASTPEANDLSENWCAATSPYGAGDQGTPGAASKPCP